jgi:[protein-PII] uridylyltransferase
VTVVADGDRVTILLPDHPGRLAAVAGVLTLQRLPVRSASASTTGGTAVDTFHVDRSLVGVPDWGVVAAAVATGIADPQGLKERLARRAANDRQPGTTAVRIDNVATPRATVVEVRTLDGSGVLHRICQALSDAGLDIRSAKVQTIGRFVIDSFYVTAADGSKVEDEAEIAGIESGIVAALDGPW